MAQTLSVLELVARAQQKPAFNVPGQSALMQYAGIYRDAAAGSKHVDPCMLAAIVLRESGGQNILQNGMSPGPDCGVGLCQITAGVDWTDLSTPVYPGYGPLMDPATNVRVAAHAFLDPLLSEFAANHVAAFAAYNAGAGTVQRAIAAGHTADSCTTGGNYGTDVFTNWITFVAESIGVNVDWTSHRPAAAMPSPQPRPQPQQPVGSGASAPARSSAARHQDSDLSND